MGKNVPANKTTFRENWFKHFMLDSILKQAKEAK